MSRLLPPSIAPSPPPPPPPPPPPQLYASASYYIATVRHRVNEVSAELTRLRKKCASLTRAQDQARGYQTQYDIVLQNVRALEGTLADYNLAFDKLRTSLDPAELHLYQQQLQARNTDEARVLDDLSRHRQRLEREVAAWQEEQARTGKAGEDGARRFLDPAQYQLFQELQQQHQLLEAEAQAQRNEDETRQDDAADEEQRHFQALEARLYQLERERRHLEEEGEVVLLLKSNSRQAHAHLLTKIKEDNKRAADVEARCKQLREELAAHSHPKVEEVEFGQTDAQHRHLEELEEAVQQARHEHQEAQEAVDTLMDFLEGGRRQEEEEINPGHDDDKKKKATRTELLAEQSRRLQELEKMSEVDERITVELGNLRQKAEALRQEMAEWATVQEWVGQQHREEGLVAEKEAAQNCAALKQECLGLVARLNALHCEKIMVQQHQHQRRIV